MGYWDCYVAPENFYDWLLNRLLIFLDIYSRRPRLGLHLLLHGFSLLLLRSFLGFASVNLLPLHRELECAIEVSTEGAPPVLVLWRVSRWRPLRYWVWISLGPLRSAGGCLCVLDFEGDEVEEETSFRERHIWLQLLERLVDRPYLDCHYYLWSFACTLQSLSSPKLPVLRTAQLCDGFHYIIYLHVSGWNIARA